MAIEKYYSFIKGNDTMTINCRCGQKRNYYLKNLDFKTGSFESSKQEIKGKQLPTPKEVQDMLFKNAFVWWESKIVFKDLYFKDLKFIEIDLNDTINVKLSEIKTSANKLLPKAGLNGLE